VNQLGRFGPVIVIFQLGCIGSAIPDTLLLGRVKRKLSFFRDCSASIRREL